MKRSSDPYVLLPVDKQHALPPDYRPDDLVLYVRADKHLQVRHLIVPDLDALLASCERAAGEAPLVVSAYRSYEQQAALFISYVQDEMTAGLSAEKAQDRANSYSARPGHSEHQLGTTVDLSVASLSYDLESSFAQTPAGVWLRVNAHHHGFAFSYPAGKEQLTGYVHEPWHMRWIGRQQAALLYSAGYLDPGSPLTLGRWLAGRSGDRGIPAT